MPKKNRLSRADFATLDPRGGRRFTGAYFTLTVTPLSSDVSGPRCAAVVSKKVSKRAVDRNAIKRRVREIIRMLITKDTPSLSLVFYAKKESLIASFEDVRRDIEVLSESAFARYNNSR
jgi:ribonuclease P protein component